MINAVAYLKNPVLRRFWEHGGEEIVDPHVGPLHLRQVDPQPDPWRTAVAELVRAAQMKDLASRLPEGRLKSGLVKSAGTAIEMILDDWCGTPPRRHPWPGPGPAPWVSEIVSELSFVAHSLQVGSLQEALLEVAAQALQKANAAV